MPGFNMDDYVPVNERIAAFMKEHPQGSLQSEIVELTESRVTVKAYAYRSPDDPRPGTGLSSLEIPGKTTFTRGSEIENAETSAWGRAIAALGFEVKRGIASSEEVRNKQPESNGSRPGGATPNRARSASVQYRRGELVDLMREHGLNHSAVEAIADRIGIPRQERPMTDESMDRLIAAIETPDPARAHAEDLAGEAVARAASPSDLLESAAAITGGTLEPPRPGTESYRALPAQQKVEARAWWQAHPEPEAVEA